MRSFIAIELPDDVKQSLFDLQKKLHNLPAKVNWVAKKNLHITIKFLGEIAEEQRKKVEEELSKIAFKKFRLTLKDVGVFPSPNYVRVIWAGLNPADKVINLQMQIDQQLLPFFHQEQNFEAHVTLGRVKFVSDKPALQESLSNVKPEEKSFEVDSFKLMKSELTKTGPIYKELKEFHASS